MQRIRELTGWPETGRVRILTDTSDCMRILRGHVVRIGGRDFVIEGNRHETRFGIGDQPKCSVFGALGLETGRDMILKTVFHEEFNVHIGVFRVRCYRSPQKEAHVLDVVLGDGRFMQGYTELDEAGNHVRIIEFIKGPSIFQRIHNSRRSHEAYYHEGLPGVPQHLTACLEAIEYLHDHGTCHGDIRHDHVIIDRETGRYRWIDFDLNQPVSDFDVWSMGNILNYAVGRAINSFHVVPRSDKFYDAVRRSLHPADGSAFYGYRLINPEKLFPCLSQRLNDILMHFAIRPRGHYGTMDELLSDDREMLDADFPAASTGRPDAGRAGGDRS